MDLGIAVEKACQNITQPLRFLYPLDISIKDKIEAIAKSYGASGVEYSDQVDRLLHPLLHSPNIVKRNLFKEDSFLFSDM